MLGIDNSPAGTFADQLAAINAWWADAGVDLLFDDEPHGLLAEPAAAAEQRTPGADPAPEPEAPPPPRFDRSALPNSLEAFTQWWLDPATELPLGHGRRIAPRGAPNARLMVLVPMPEPEDGERLLGGAQGQLIASILRALGLTEDDAYFASALPCATTMPDWPGLGHHGLADITAHHVSLAAPDRVLLLGDRMGRMLGLAQGSGQFMGLPALAARAPDHLLANPRLRARLWPALLDWMPSL